MVPTIRRIKNSEWIKMWQDLLSGAERELPTPVQSETMEILTVLRARLSDPGVVRRRKRFEQDLEESLNGNPLLKAATEQYLGKKTVLAVAAAEALIKRAERYLANCKTDRRRRKKATQLKKAAALFLNSAGLAPIQVDILPVRDRFSRKLPQ
jgi:hypothetical protein